MTSLKCTCFAAAVSVALAGGELFAASAAMRPQLAGHPIQTTFVRLLGLDSLFGGCPPGRYRPNTRGLYPNGIGRPRRPAYFGNYGLPPFNGRGLYAPGTHYDLPGRLRYRVPALREPLYRPSTPSYLPTNVPVYYVPGATAPSNDRFLSQGGGHSPDVGGTVSQAGGTPFYP